MTVHTRPFPRLLPALLAALWLLAPAAFAQQPDTLRHSIPAPPVLEPDFEGYMGESVATNGEVVVTGLTLAGNGAGAVKVFDASTGELLHTLANPSPATFDYFGASVGISGMRVVVGASYDDTGAMDAGSVYVYDLTSATPTVPVAILNNPSPAAEDHFGAVAISGTRLVVGAGGDDTGASGAGIVYVYDLSGAMPTVPVATLNNPSPATTVFFGNSVAMDGMRVVVGALTNDFSGIAYVYDLASGTPTVPVATLNNPGAPAGDFFGASVGISGTRVVVGAYYDDTGATDAGSAYVYDLSSATPTMPVSTLNNPSPMSDDWFGLSVAILGMRVVVGATNGGKAYVYDLGSETPTAPAITLIDPEAGSDGTFGYSVAIAGTQMVVGAPHGSYNGSAYLYDLGSTTPTVSVARLINVRLAHEDQFGISMAISGTRMVVGAYLDNTGEVDAGSVYVYDLAGPVPTVPVATLNGPVPAVNDWFGISVAISGRRVVVGAERDDTGAADAGSAYVYDVASATPTVPVATLHNPTPAASDLFGHSVAVSGTRVVIGADLDNSGAADAGSAYVYDLAGVAPAVPVATLLNPTPVVGDRFGFSVAISGTRLVVGAPSDDTGATNAGSAYVYDLAGATPMVPVATLNNPSPAITDWFGYSVAIAGTRVAVGAYRDDTGATDAGSVYVYDLAGATPTVPVATLNNPGAAVGDFFGASVGISGTRVVVGAYYDDTGATDAGSAYVYDLSSATPTVPVSTLNNPNPVASDQFGYSVAISGSTTAIGAPLDDSVALNKGYAYVFAPANPDYDGDGLLDLWEEARFGSITAHTAGDDTDGDGRVELLEQAFDTDPLFSDPPTVLPQVVSEAGFLTITLGKRAGISYTVETAGSPGGGAFSNAATTIITDNASTLKVRDNFTPATAGQRFMRVKVQPAP